MSGISAHRGFWDREARRSLYFGIALLILSFGVQIAAGSYSARNAAKNSSVGDLFLDLLPTVNLDFLIVEGAVFLWVVTTVLLVYEPRYLLFGIKAVALFIATRSIFLTLTHVGLYPEQAIFDQNGIADGFYHLITFHGNYFFSGHTGLPFLIALVLWPNKPVRVFFFAVSAVFGASVLLAHVHYSIDVFAAPFMAYGIFRVAERLFARDYAILLEGTPRIDTPRGA